MVRAALFPRTKFDEGRPYSQRKRTHIMSNELFDLSGQVAIVTGTSRGLGQHFARALAKAGADLVITSRNTGSLAKFEDEIRAT